MENIKVYVDAIVNLAKAIMEIFEINAVDTDKIGALKSAVEAFFAAIKAE